MEPTTFDLSYTGEMLYNACTTVLPTSQTKHGFTSSTTYRRIVLTILILECLLTLGINPVTLVSIARYKKLRQHCANILIFSLTLSDLLGGVVNLWMFVTSMLMTFGWVVPQAVFWYHFGMGAVVLYTMIFSVLAIGIDRLIATWKPLSYKVICSPKNCLVSIIIIWTVFILLIPGLMITKYLSMPLNKRNQMLSNYMQFFPDGIFVYLMMPLIYVAMATNGLIYLVICKILLNQKQKLADAMTHKATIERNRINRISFFIMSLLFLTWIPQFVEVSVPYPKPDEQFHLYHIRVCIHDIVTIVFMSNSFLNSFVYAWQHSEYRKAYRKLLYCSSTVQQAPKNGPVNTSVFIVENRSNSHSVS